MAASAHIQYDPARHITGECTEVLAPARAVKVSAAKTDGGNIKVEYADGGAATAGSWFGVTGPDSFQTIGDCGDIYRRGSVCEIEASGTVAALDFVKLAANGTIVPATATGDVIIGQALTGATSGNRPLVDTFAAPTVLKLS